MVNCIRYRRIRFIDFLMPNFTPFPYLLLVLQLREALRISESYHIFSFVKFVGYHAERYSGGDYKSFLDFKIFNPKTSELLPFSIFQLQHSDGKPLKYDGVNIELTTFTLGSDIYIIPLRRSDEFWVFRGKSQKLELMNFPNEESWSTHFTYSLHKKLIFGSFTSLSKRKIYSFIPLFLLLHTYEFFH